MLRNVTLAVAMICTCVPAAQNAFAELDTIRVGSGFSRPIYVTAPVGDMSRLFVVEQRGLPVSTSARIMIINLTTSPPTTLATPYMTLAGVATGNEQGLLGMAFDPNYATNGRFYLNYTATGGTTRIERYTDANPNDQVYTEGSPPLILLSFAQPESNHNGGWVGFGPDGYLYIATGDGGGANDQHGANGNAQNLSSLLGKLLRIDVSGASYTVPSTNPFPGATPPFNTIWAYGLRNPWRSSFDRLTGELYIGDVGRFAIEEISVQPADNNGSMGGRNYGWRCMEGNNCTGLSGCTCNSANLVLPVHAYGHSLGRCSVTGGYAYRGSATEGQGHYFFSDYCGGQIYSFQYTGANNPPIIDRTAELAPTGFSINNVTSFGEDAAGEMYIVDQTGGEIFQVIQGAPPPPFNDLCGNAPVIVAGAHAFTTVNATTDGPNEAGCTFGGYSHIENDVWYRYAAQCTGNATFSLCGAAYNAKLAVYGTGCPTGPGQQLACSDDFCGTSPQVTIPVTFGLLYRVRIGGFQAATGTGTLNITCTVPQSCGPDIDGNNVVNVDDLLGIINAWGPCAAPCPADIVPAGGNGLVNVDDLLAVISAWGPCP